MIRLSLSFDETLQAARDYGFEGVELDQTSLVDVDPARVKQRILDAGVRVGGFSAPVSIAADEATYQEGLRALPDIAARAAEVGATRSTLGIRPWSDDRDWDDNRRFTVQRMQPVAAILAEHGCRLGLEYIGPATSRHGHRYPFVHTMEGALALAREIGSGTGLLLDAWHWYTSKETPDDIARLTNDDVVSVHVNDAPPGIPVDEQKDLERLMPGASGVIDIRGFLDALLALNYDGPVIVEPFDKTLQALDGPGRLRATADSLAKIMRGAGA
jgi:sugar phosphate isomerase/epimerase